MGAWVQANNLLKSPPIPISAFSLYSSFKDKENSYYQAKAEYQASSARSRPVRSA